MKDGTDFEFHIQTDNYADENRWEILNSSNEVIAFDNELVSNYLNTFSFCQDMDSCYTLVVYDDYDDGICCDFGNGYIMVNNQVTSGEFSNEAVIDLCTISEIKEDLKNPFSIYPNPSSGILTIESDLNIEDIRVYDLLGKIVLQKSCQARLEKLNLYYLKKGTYLVQISTKNNYIFYKKIILQ